VVKHRRTTHIVQAENENTHTLLSEKPIQFVRRSLSPHLLITISAIPCITLRNTMSSLSVTVSWKSGFHYLSSIRSPLSRDV